MLPSEENKTFDSALLGRVDDDTGLDLGMSPGDGSDPTGFASEDLSPSDELLDPDGGEAALLDEDDDEPEKPSKKPMGKLTKLALAAGAVVVLGMGGLVGAQKMGLLNGAPAPKTKPSLPKLEDAPRPALVAPSGPELNAPPANNPFGPPAQEIAPVGVAPIAPVDLSTPTVNPIGPANPFGAPSVAPSVPAVPVGLASPPASGSTTPLTNPTDMALTPPPTDPFSQQTTPPVVTPNPVVAPVKVAPTRVEAPRVEKVEKPVKAKTVVITEEADEPKVKKPAKHRPAPVKKPSVVSKDSAPSGQQESHPSFDQLTPKNTDNFYGYEKLF